MLKYDNLDDSVEINWAGVKVIMVVPCNVGRPCIVSDAVAGILEIFFTYKPENTSIYVEI